MMPDAILFDLDGTLVDGAAAIHDAFEHALREAELPPVPRGDVAARIGMPLRFMFRDLCGVDERIAAGLVRYYRARFEAMAPHLVAPAVGMREAIAAFPALPMAIVTTKAADPARVVLKALGIEDRFAAVIGVDSVLRPKPDPEGARVALARLGVAPLNSVFVGDTIMDVLAGKGAGTRTIALTSGHGDPGELKAAQPDALIASLRELPAAIAAL